MIVARLNRPSPRPLFGESRSLAQCQTMPDKCRRSSTFPTPALARYSRRTSKRRRPARAVPLLEQSAYAPAAGKLAAAMATIPARRRPTRKPAALSKDFKRRISTDPGDGRGFSARKSTPKKSALTQWYGQAPRACRDHSENSNAATVRSLCGSRIIAAKEPAMDKIFSAKMALDGA